MFSKVSLTACLSPRTGSYICWNPVAFSLSWKSRSVKKSLSMQYSIASNAEESSRHCMHTMNLSLLGLKIVIELDSNVLTQSNLGTQYQCRSQKFQKTVRYISEICQKTVNYKNVSENCHKCVRILSENCQMQISVRTL